MKYLLLFISLLVFSCTNLQTYSNTLNQYTAPVPNKNQSLIYKNLNSSSRSLTVTREVVESKNGPIISQLRAINSVKSDSTTFELDNQIDPLDFYSFADGKATKIDLSVVDETSKAICTQIKFINGTEVSFGKGVSFIKKDTTFNWQGKNYDAILIHSFDADASEKINLNKIDSRKVKVNAYNIYAKELGLVKYGTKGVDEWELESIM